MAAPKPKKGKVPIPDVEVFAHPRGNIQWQCPNCGSLYSFNTGFRRTGRIRCVRQGCKRRFRVGVHFSDYNPTYTAWIMPNRWNGFTANRLNLPYLIHDGQEAPGSLFGTMDWRCPNCQKLQTSDIPFHLPAVSCTCGGFWYISLLIYHPNYQPKQLFPLDWSPYDSQAVIESLPIKTFNS